MSLWSRIADALAALRSGEGLANVFDKLRTPPEQRVGFAIAVIALGAKMAKADGQVTRDEVMAFREVFSIPKGEEQNAARVFNMARTDVAGYEDYAARVARMFGPGSATLCDVIEGLFHIAMADGEYHPGEDMYLARVAELFGIDERRFRAMRARFVPGGRADPFEVLGVDPDTPMADIRAAYRALVRDTHPDALAARGVPPEAVKLAEDRLICINNAWDEVQALRLEDKPA
ncbi:TerB family tellurite resistance protein [Aliiroseovarius sp. PTFE2010]|uniref:TerB family tellurite resistance protein n=1 Tax=Aliiroseovarius sp. PTFE2010 TaxID=3417190 RepID=UPI003CEB6CE1